MLKKIEDLNYYELLEVSPRATSQEIHKAYERIRKIYDPNSIALYSLFSPDETEKIRQRVEEAYRTLIYEENRRMYDLSLRDYLDELPPQEQPPARPVSATPVQPSHPSSVPPASPPMPSPAAYAAPAPAAPAPVPPPPVAALPVQPPPQDIAEFSGTVLRMLREQRGMTIQNVADTTKLSARYLECIEEENFAKLPARPYLRGFLVNYAKALGYEPDRIAADFLKRYDAFKNPPKK
ncbi:MAG: helix-turn-helix domain-containing protein [Nitrospiraceae bacterium]|nr:helix-turn-helix domain-containing protein [Nitrospiraceae bacterium]